MLPLVFGAISQEKYLTVRAVLRALFRAVKRILGIWLPDYIAHYSYDGNPGAVKALGEMVPDAEYHLCLQHAKENVREHAGPRGFRELVPQLQDFLAHLRPALFHVCVDTLLENLRNGGQDALHTYLTVSAVSAGLRCVNGVWISSWKGSIVECEAGYGGYLPNLPESFHSKSNAMVGSGKKDTTDQMISKTQKQAVVFKGDVTFNSIVPLPDDSHEPNRLLRGKGAWMP